MKVSIKFKPQDIWVGIFNARRTKYAGAVYITLIPCFPLEIRWSQPPRDAGFVMLLRDIPGSCPECKIPLQNTYFTLDKTEVSETGCFIHICTECGRTWRQGNPASRR